MSARAARPGLLVVLRGTVVALLAALLGLVVVGIVLAVLLPETGSTSTRVAATVVAMLAAGAVGAGAGSVGVRQAAAAGAEDVREALLAGAWVPAGLAFVLTAPFGGIGVASLATSLALALGMVLGGGRLAARLA